MPFTPNFYSETWPNGYAFAKLVVKMLDDIQPLESVFEAGCGAGGFLKWCFEHNKEIMGVEISDVLPVAVIPTKYIRIQDLRQQVRLPEMPVADLCVSLEVAEHISEDYIDIFIDNICFLCPEFILFSAARPGQPGDGHINCQPQEYWIQKIESRGFRFMPGLTGILRGNVDIPTYYRENSLIFRRK